MTVEILPYLALAVMLLICYTLLRGKKSTSTADYMEAYDKGFQVGRASSDIEAYNQGQAAGRLAFEGKIPPLVFKEDTRSISKAFGTEPEGMASQYNEAIIYVSQIVCEEGNILDGFMDIWEVEEATMEERILAMMILFHVYQVHYLSLQDFMTMKTNMNRLILGNKGLSTETEPLFGLMEATIASLERVDKNPLPDLSKMTPEEAKKAIKEHVAKVAGRIIKEQKQEDTVNKDDDVTTKADDDSFLKS